MENSYNFAFFADTHLDYSYASRTDDQGVNLRVRDGYNALKEIVNDIILHKDELDAVVIGGDLFHISQPSIRTIAVTQHYLRQLAKHNIPVHILAGNHDSTDDRSKPAAVAVTHDPDREIFAYYKPYEIVKLAPGMNLHILSHHGLHKNDAPVLAPVEGEINILSSHGAAVDPSNATLMRCLDSPREQIISPEIILDENFHLRVLGHYHSRHAVGGDANLNTWYSGSTLRRGFSDAPGARGWTKFSVDTAGNVSYEHHDIFQRPQYDFETINASGLTSSELEEQIINNLLTTINSEKGDQFDEVNAPIIRQRVINVTRSIREGLNRKNLSDHSKYALKWNLELVRPEHSAQALAVASQEQEEAEGINQAPSMEKSSGATLNIMKTFEEWKGNSNILKEIAQDYKKPVQEEVQDHLKKAQEEEN